jgi:two-component system, NarL family, sensor kinase
MLVLIAASVPLGIHAHKSFFGGGGVGLLFTPFAVVGLIVARRQPRNSIGWILLALALMMILSTDAGLYSLIAFQLGHPNIPLARLATALTQTWIALVVLLPLPILLFPDGRLPSRRWRWSFWLYRSRSGSSNTGSMTSTV